MYLPTSTRHGRPTSKVNINFPVPLAPDLLIACLSDNMSSQNDAGIPVSHSPNDVGYKLMELPPELLEALESASPPESVLNPFNLNSLSVCPNGSILRLG